MICKVAEYENGYVFGPGDRKRTNEDWRRILKEYDEVKCIICNSNTAKNFYVTGGYNYITINNKIADGCFFINRIR